MEKGTFISNYFEHFKRVAFDNSIEPMLLELSNLLKSANAKGNKIIFAGNGASATIASHCALDFTKQAGIRAMSFNDPAIITAYGTTMVTSSGLLKLLSIMPTLVISHV